MRQTLPLPALLLVLLLAGCAVDGTPRLTLAERSAPLPDPLPVAFDGEPAGKAGRVAKSLARMLETDAVAAASAQGPVLLVTASTAPARLGLAVEGKPGEALRWLSPPRRNRAFEACRAERLHASVTAPAFAAHAEVDFCTLDDARIDALAGQLAQAVRAN